MAFEGVSAAAVTPRGKAGNEVDLGAALELIDFLSTAGVAGIELLGAAGEFPNLGADARSRLTYMAIKRSRLPVLVGVSHSDLDGAVELGREAVYGGAAGLVLQPPWFYCCGPAEIREFYLRFADHMPREVPLFLEHAPALAGAIDPATAASLLASGRFAGIKDSGSDPGYLEPLRDLSVTLLSGDDALFPHADGVVSAAACAVPELILALHRAPSAQLQARLGEFRAWTSRFPAPLGVKAAAAARGLKLGPPAIPPACETQRQLDEFQAWFRAWLPVVRKEIS